MADGYVSDTGPFALIPEWVIGLPVSHGSFRLYATIARFADYDTGQAFPSRQTLAGRLSVSTDTVDRWLRELEKAGALEITRRKDGPINQTNLYRIIRLIPAAEGGRNDAATPTRKDAATGGRKDAAQTKTTIDRYSPKDIVDIFQAWLDSTGRDETRTRLDDKRKRIIQKALDLYPAADLVAAVQGWKQSAFHRGENENRKTYNDLSLLLRDAEHIERFRDLHRTASRRGSKRAARPYDVVRPEPCGKCEDGWMTTEDERGRSASRLCDCQKQTA